MILLCGHGMCEECFQHWRILPTKVHAESAGNASNLLVVTSVTSRNNDEGAEVFPGRQERHKYYCGRHLGRAAIPGSDGRCGPTNGPQCQSCIRYQVAQRPPDSQTSQVNDEGAEVLPGRQERHKYYCGRHLGRAAIPGSDGRCGPTNGPQCQSCIRYQVAQRPPDSQTSQVNDEGAEVLPGRQERHKYYCGRRLGRAAIPGSDGRCGPTNGPQCQSCIRYQVAQRPPDSQTSQVNDEGAEVFPGRQERHRYYCGRHLGRAAIPGSHGRCGPTNGPQQCQSCIRYQVAQRPPDSQTSQVNDEGAEVFPGRQERHRYYCGRHLGRAAIPGSDGRCGPTNGPQCQSCIRYQVAQRPPDSQTSQVNDEGAEVFPGRQERHRYYCGRHLGRAAIPGSDGRCGPTNGPQCQSCIRYQVAQRPPDSQTSQVNDEGAEVFPGRQERHRYYCGRHLGRAAIPGSDGRCGPTNGPQCQSCIRYQVAQRPPDSQTSQVNDEGAEVFPGRQERHRYYCGRHLGRAAIPGSDGRCGPTNGPQCQSCIRYQVAQRPPDSQPCQVNDEGAEVFPGRQERHRYYCSRHLGRAAILGSDGRCGPTNGPQCQSCIRYQVAQRPPDSQTSQVNDEGAEVFPGRQERHRILLRPPSWEGGYSWF